MESETQSRGTPRVLAGSARPFKTLIDASALTAALVDPTPVTAKALTEVGAAHGVMDVDGHTVARIIFGGTDTANQIINYQVILWNEVLNAGVTPPAAAWVGRVIAKGTAVLGSDVYAAGGVGFGAATNLFADTITDIIGRARLFSPEDNTRAVLEVPLLNAQRFEVQTDLNDAVSADAFVQLGEASIATGRRKVAFAEKANATIRVDGTSVGAVALAATPTPYVQANVLARKPGADANTASGANAGTVWICGSATSMVGARPLEPGQNIDLPDNGDLADFFLAVENIDDGVAIIPSA